MDMEYRRLGNSGLKVSVLSFGSWVTFGPQLDSGLAADCMAAAFDAGCNFFDNAEAYAGGRSEELMGEAIAKNGWKRHEYVVSSKFYWGIHDTPNTRQHAESQVPARGHTGLPRPDGSRLSRPDLLPPGRPRHADRGDGVGDVRHHRPWQGAVLGNLGVVRR